MIIANKDINLKWSFRSLFLFEEITGKGFEVKTIEDSVTYFYCVASTSGVDMTLSEFVAWLDDNPKALNEFVQWMVSVAESQSKDEPAADIPSELKKKDGCTSCVER